MAARRGIPFFAAGVLRKVEFHVQRAIGMLWCLEIEFHAGRPRRAAPTVRSVIFDSAGGGAFFDFGPGVAEADRSIEDQLLA